MNDPRLEAANLLTAIRCHDPNLSPFDIQDIDRAICVLDDSIETDRMKAARDMQTPILDLVIPAGDNRV